MRSYGEPKQVIIVLRFRAPPNTDMTMRKACCQAKLCCGEREAIRAELGDFRFDTPYGKEIRRFLTFGVGIHHADRTAVRPTRSGFKVVDHLECCELGGARHTPWWERRVDDFRPTDARSQLRGNCRH